MRRMKNKKLKAILSITGYFLLVVAICFSAALVFHSTYYELIYVSGNSMSPTLNGSESEKAGSVVDFGIIDTHKVAIKNIKRFSIVSTYYSDDYSLSGRLIPNAKQKIKRIVAMPGETFKIEDSKLYVLKDGEFEYIPYTFSINPSEGDTSKDIAYMELKEDEYWVLGDNRINSRDCGTLNEPVKKEYLIGVLVAIEGKAELKLKRMVCPNCGRSYIDGTSICANLDCLGVLTPEYELIHKKYQWPKYY